MVKRFSILLVLCYWPASVSLAVCPGDLDNDANVGITDFLMLLSEWGEKNSPADLDGDGSVGITDFLMLLAVWGPCPEPPLYPTPPTIVVYNLNARDIDANGINDAKEIAEYYVAARGLDPSALCGVQLPTGDYATPDELLEARRTIVEDCICSVVSPRGRRRSAGRGCAGSPRRSAGRRDCRR